MLVGARKRAGEEGNDRRGRQERRRETNVESRQTRYQRKEAAMSLFVAASLNCCSSS